MPSSGLLGYPHSHVPPQLVSNRTNLIMWLCGCESCVCEPRVISVLVTNVCIARCVIFHEDPSVFVWGWWWMLVNANGHIWARRGPVSEYEWLHMNLLYVCVCVYMYVCVYSYAPVHTHVHTYTHSPLHRQNTYLRADQATGSIRNVPTLAEPRLEGYSHNHAVCGFTCCHVTLGGHVLFQIC